MRRRRAAVVLALTATALAIATTSCLDPTEITLEVTTDVPCTSTKGASFTGGSSAVTTEGAAPNTTTSHCEGGGDIGTLVAAPSATKDTSAAFVVALGVDRPVSECTAANHFKGCVVQRRSIRYVKHKPISLPINMWLVCKDVECDANSTCARTGKCVPSEIPNPESCADTGCYPNGDTPDIPGADASGIDGPLADGPHDSGSDRDGSIRDADADAPFVVPPPPPAGMLYCPPVASGCAQLTTCCWAQGGTGGHCGPPCSVDDIPLQCDRKSDCLGQDAYCCGTVVDVINAFTPDAASVDGGVRTLTSSTCSMFPGPACSTIICTTDADCPATLPTCDRASTLFKPTGIFGECILP